ncbi:MAG: glycosyltransferase family 39 protein [Tepidisphaeraceae bacterium]|jgi:hypothetical protein
MTTAQIPAPAVGSWFAGRYRLAAWGLILLGVAVRLRVYLADRSLWRDEAPLALSLMRRNFAGLLKPLVNPRAAPVGFLMIQKLDITLLGSSEYALRLAPLLASVIALVLFWRLCRNLLGPRAAVIALAILALSYRQFYFASESKQYSFDVLVGVGVLTLAVGALGLGPAGIHPTKRGLLALGAVGAAAVWCSYPSLSVLAAIAAATVWLLPGSSKQTIGRLCLVALAWVISFGLNYLLVLHRLSHDDYLQSFWSQANAFAPIPRSFSAITWYKKSLLEIFEDPLGLDFAQIAALAFICGAAVLYREHKPAVILLLTPIALALAAAMLHQYPFKGRLILFITPLLAAVIGAGMDWLLQGQRRLAGWVALILLMISPVTMTARYLTHPPAKYDQRGALGYIASHRQEQDICYLDEYCESGFEYYQNRFGLNGAKVIVGKRNVAGWDDYAADLSKLAGHRAWVIFEDTAEHGGMNEQQMALHILDGMGQRILEPDPQPMGEYVACYDLRR